MMLSFVKLINITDISRSKATLKYRILKFLTNIKFVRGKKKKQVLTLIFDSIYSSASQISENLKNFSSE